MNSFIRSPKDFWAATIYLGVGLTAILLASDYGMGTALKMGPAYFPSVLGGLLILIGLISLIRSFITAGEPVPPFAYKPLIMIIGATVLFGATVRGAGLLIALPVFVIITAYGSAKFRWGPALALAAGMTIFCSLVFIKGLGIPLPLLGPWLGM